MFRKTSTWLSWSKTNTCVLRSVRRCELLIQCLSVRKSSSMSLFSSLNLQTLQHQSVDLAFSISYFYSLVSTTSKSNCTVWLLSLNLLNAVMLKGKGAICQIQRLAHHFSVYWILYFIFLFWVWFTYLSSLFQVSPLPVCVCLPTLMFFTCV